MRFSKTIEEAIIKKACSIHDSGLTFGDSEINPLPMVQIFIGTKPKIIIGFISKPKIDHPIKDKIIYIGLN